ncbi:MAG TPA: ABC transporter ATP-binding protein [Pelomicrobium sp.]|nr:ABC transporter ATP-binding protein [Pelomicrobium sp.]
MQEKVSVEIENIALAYGTTEVLRDITLNVEPGEFFALLGPSGSGKSTLLRLIAGFAQSQRGVIRVGGRDISRVPPWQRDIGMVFQNYALWPHMTVAQNVAFGLEERRLPKTQVRDKVDAALALVGLGEFRDRRPSQLSGGQQQRVALARTIAIEPKVLLLDEPLSNLDAKLRVHMRQELQALQRKLGITSIFVTHDQEEAMTICDRVAVLDQGVLQQVGHPIELYDRPANRFVANFVGTINMLSGAVRRDGTGLVFESPMLGGISLAGLDAAAEGPAEFAFRPHAVDLRVADGDPSRLWIGGRIQGQEFLGEFVRYHVDVAGSTVIADQPHLRGVPVFEGGCEVRLGIALSEIQILTA